MSINAINLSTLYLKKTANVNLLVDVKIKEEKSEENQNPKIQKQISADDVLNYMSATSSMPVKMKKSVNVSAYVDKISASRISDSINQFENEFNAKLSSVKSELGGISNELAEKIALLMI